MKLTNVKGEVIFESESNLLVDVLKEAKEQGVSLAGLLLKSVNLSSCDLSGLDLTGIEITRCNINEVNFEGSNLTNGMICQSNIKGCNLSKCDLDKLTVDRSNITNCDGFEVINLDSINNICSNVRLYLSEEDKLAQIKEDEERELRMHAMEESIEPEVVVTQEPEQLEEVQESK